MATHTPLCPLCCTPLPELEKEVGQVYIGHADAQKMTGKQYPRFIVRSHAVCFPEVKEDIRTWCLAKGPHKCLKQNRMEKGRTPGTFCHGSISVGGCTCR